MPETPNKVCYDNGNVYEGELKNIRPNGKGKMIYNRAHCFKEYNGHWENGKQHAEYGKMIYRSGDIHEGSWRDGKPHGEGRVIYPNGTIFEANWSNGRLQWTLRRIDIRSGY